MRVSMVSAVNKATVLLVEMKMQEMIIVNRSLAS